MSGYLKVYSFNLFDGSTKVIYKKKFSWNWYGKLRALARPQVGKVTLIFSTFETAEKQSDQNRIIELFKRSLISKDERDSWLKQGDIAMQNKEYQWVDMEDGGRPYVRLKDGSDILSDYQSLLAQVEADRAALQDLIDSATVLLFGLNPLKTGAVVMSSEIDNSRVRRFSAAITKAQQFLSEGK